MLDESFRNQVHVQCYQYYEGGFTVDLWSYQQALKSLNLKDLWDDQSWTYKPSQDCVKINNEYSYDMDLFFKEEDMRYLYRWDDSMEFLAICELVSGDFPECQRGHFKNQEDFKVCVEAKLTLLNCFNFISEDAKVRKVLYNVCRFNKSKHVYQHKLEADGKTQQNSTAEDNQDDCKNFQERFTNYKEFENLFE